jgi:4-hydroxyproline epimerase
VGSIFQAQGEWDGDRVRATVTGKAYLTAESTLLLQRDDPYQSGF